MFKGTTLSLTKIDNRFAEINFDNQSESVNKFNSETIADLRSAVALLKQEEGIQGLLLSSSKSVFVVGADITEFKDMFAETKANFIAGAQSVNALFSEIEDLPFPSVAAINGFALGGGFEVCLACDARVISAKAAVGLPETGLGIIPGWGGTVRLPRLVGFSTAVHWIASGEQQRPDAALKAGAVGYMLKQDDLSQLGEAIREIARGGAVMGPQIARKVMEFFGQGRVHMPDVQSLSDQEKTVAQWVVLGRTTQEIVDEMNISAGLVKFHLRNMYQKLQVHNRQTFIKKFKK
mgnify:CR=1 FL=1